MRQSLAFVSFLASMAFADDTIQFFFPGGADGSNAIATITEANPSTTAMRIACPTDTDSTDCGWGTGVDYTIISTTIYEVSMSADTFTMSFECDHNVAKKEMTCNIDMEDETQTDGSGSTSGVLSGTDVSFLTATIVKGAELLSGSETAAPKSTGASSGFPMTASATGTAATAGQHSASGASGTGSGALPQHTGAASRFGIEGSALLVLAGAAALHAL